MIVRTMYQCPFNKCPIAFPHERQVQNHMNADQFVGLAFESSLFRIQYLFVVRATTLRHTFAVDERSSFMISVHISRSSTMSVSCPRPRESTMDISIR